MKAGLIEADHEECAIVVHYEIEATVLGENGEPMVGERTVSEGKGRGSLGSQGLDRGR